MMSGFKGLSRPRNVAMPSFNVIPSIQTRVEVSARVQSQKDSRNGEMLFLDHDGLKIPTKYIAGSRRTLLFNIQAFLDSSIASARQRIAAAPMNVATRFLAVCLSSSSFNRH